MSDAITGGWMAVAAKWAWAPVSALAAAIGWWFARFVRRTDERLDSHDKQLQALERSRGITRADLDHVVERLENKIDTSQQEMNRRFDRVLQNCVVSRRK